MNAAGRRKIYSRAWVNYSGAVVPCNGFETTKGIHTTYLDIIHIALLYTFILFKKRIKKKKIEKNNRKNKHKHTGARNFIKSWNNISCISLAFGFWNFANFANYASPLREIGMLMLLKLYHNIYGVG